MNILDLKFPVGRHYWKCEKFVKILFFPLLPVYLKIFTAILVIYCSIS